MQWLLPCLLALSIGVQAQVRVHNENLTDVRQPVLYQGIRNTLVVRGAAGKRPVQLEVAGERPQALDDSVFVLYPRQTGPARVTVKAGNTILCTAAFRIDSLPDSIVVRVGPYSDTVLTVRQVLLHPFLTVSVPGTIYKGFYVMNFGLRIRKADGDEFHTGGGDFYRFSAAQLQAIRNLAPGALLQFESISGGGPDSRMRRLPSFTVLIR